MVPFPSIRMMYATVNDAAINAKSTTTSTRRRRWTKSERRNDVVSDSTGARLMSAR